MAFPTTSPPALTEWQLQLGGLTCGPGTSYPLAGLTGMDLPAIRAGDSERSRDHGQLIGLNLYDGRNVTVDLEVDVTDTDFWSALESLAGATLDGLSTEEPMWLQHPTLGALAVMGRVTKRTMPWDIKVTSGKVAQVSVQVHATDPRLYGAPQTATVGLPSTGTGGLTFPTGFPAVFGGGGAGGQVTVTNNGNTEMRPTLTLTGPLTNPTVVNETITGAPALTLSNPQQTSTTIAAGDQVVVDLDLHSVLYYVGGVSSSTAPASRRAWLSGTWWNLPPGANLIRFRSDDSNDTAASLAVTWCDGWVL